MKRKASKKDEPDIKIGLPEGQTWDEEKQKRIKAYISTEAAKQSPERKLKNKMLGVKYQSEDHIEKDK